MSILSKELMNQQYICVVSSYATSHGVLYVRTNYGTKYTIGRVHEPSAAVVPAFGKLCQWYYRYIYDRTTGMHLYDMIEERWKQPFFGDSSTLHALPPSNTPDRRPMYLYYTRSALRLRKLNKFLQSALVHL